MGEGIRCPVTVDFSFEDYVFLKRVSSDLSLSVPELIRQVIELEKDAFLYNHPGFLK